MNQLPVTDKVKSALAYMQNATSRRDLVDTIRQYISELEVKVYSLEKDKAELIGLLQRREEIEKAERRDDEPGFFASVCLSIFNWFHNRRGGQ